MNRSLLLAMAGGLVCFNLMAVLPDPVDGVVTISKSTELSASDQATLNALKEIKVTIAGTSSDQAIYVKSGETVTIPCPIDFTYNNTVYVGKKGGTLIFASTVTHPAGKTIDVFGDVRLVAGSSFGAAFLLETGESDLSTIVSLDTVFPSGTASANFQTRGKTSFKFGADNVFENFSTAPLLVFGKNSNPACILDLAGHDQTIGRMSFFYGAANIEGYNAYSYVTSETAATLTVTKGFVKSTGDSDIFNGRLLGGVSFKLDADADTGVASFSNTVLKAGTQYSTTTGALICARGTIKLLEGCRFSQLSELRTENAGNFEISTSELGDQVVARLSGTGKVKLNCDLSVKYAQVWDDEKDAWAYVDAGPYAAGDGKALSDLLDGTGKLYVLNGEPDDGRVKTYTWTGAKSEDITDEDNWADGKAPELTKGKSFLVFPTTGRASAAVSGTIKVNGLQIESAGAFELKAGDDALVNVLGGGLALSDTTAQTNAITLRPPICFAASTNIACTVGDGTKVVFDGALSTFAAPGYAVSFAGAAEYEFRGDNAELSHQLYLTNATAVIACHSNAFGQAGLMLVNERMIVLPSFPGLTSCNSPITLDLPFEGSESSGRTWIPADQTPFSFNGCVTICGQKWSERSTGGGVIYYMADGYFVVNVPGDIAFADGLNLKSLRRLQFQISQGAKVRLEGDVVRESFRSNYSADNTPTEVRFYPTGNAAARLDGAVAELDCRFMQGGEVYAPQVTLRVDCDTDDIFAASAYMPWVNSRAQDKALCLGALDLAGNGLTLHGFESALPDNNEKYLADPRYVDAYYAVTSVTPATLTLDGRRTSSIFATAPWRFEGQAGLTLGPDWVTVTSKGEVTGTGTCFMTNVHSTATGNLTVNGGLLRFGAGAGWAGESQASISGTGSIQVDPGAWGFKGDKNGRKCHSKVTLTFPEEGKGRLVLNENCEVAELFVNGVEMPVGSYTKDSLSPYLEGEGTLHVCGKHPGVLLIVR